MGANIMATCQAIMTVPQRLSFSAQLTNCNVGPSWRVMTHIGASWHSAFSTFHSFKNCPWAGFGQILAVACATTEKDSCPQRHASVGKLSLSKPAEFTLGENKDRNSWIKFRLYNNSFAPASGGACAMGSEHHGIDPNISGHHDCSTKAVFLCTADKLQCWPILARNDTYWRMLTFSFLHISFIGTIA